MFIREICKYSEDFTEQHKGLPTVGDFICFACERARRTRGILPLPTQTMDYSALSPGKYGPMSTDEVNLKVGEKINSYRFFFYANCP